MLESPLHLTGYSMFACRSLASPDNTVGKYGTCRLVHTPTAALRAFDAASEMSSIALYAPPIFHIQYLAKSPIRHQVLIEPFEVVTNGKFAATLYRLPL